jgi:diguanylate cyclase (GGDEF)-like protein
VPSQRNSFELLFLCVVATAFALLPPPRAGFQAAYIVVLGAVLAVAWAAEPGDQYSVPHALTRWAVLVGTVFVVGYVLQRMARSLQRRALVAEAVADLGRRALSATEPDELLQAAVAAAVGLLETDYGTALRRLPDGRLRVAAELGPDALPTGLILTVAHSGSYALHVLNSGEAFTSTDLRTDPRIANPVPLLERGVVSGVAAPVMGAGGALGVLAVHTRRRRSFTSTEVAVVQTLANVVAVAWEQAANHELLHHQTLHDALTGLPNRALFLDRLRQALVRRGAGKLDSSESVTVMLLDLDGFKQVNDTYGHAAGDAVLRTMAERFSAAVRPDDTVARFGGDEFAVLCEVPDEKTALVVGQRILTAAAEPLGSESAPMSVGASLGITIVTGANRHEVSVEGLLAEADTALYGAKRAGRGRLEVFNETTKAEAQAQLQLENELRHAIEAEQLVLHYQPIRATAGRQLLGVEALVRWDHPRRGMLAPAEFLPLAERTGLIVPLGRWVLSRACEQVGHWQREAGLATVVAVNVSPRQLDDPNLAQHVESVLRDNAMAAGTLTLELTESALIDGGDETLDVLCSLRAAGAQLTLDDFGTGYSSLVHLARFPIATLKIDRSFVAGLGQDRRSEAIVSAVIALGNELDVGVVAEGVETEHQLSELTKLHCYAVQGYLLDLPRPLPPAMEAGESSGSPASTGTGR